MYEEVRSRKNSSSTSPLQRKPKTVKKTQSKGRSSTEAVDSVATNLMPTLAAPAQRRVAPRHEQESETVLNEKTNQTGLPDNLKAGIEILSGKRMDDVKVHFNSSKPAQVNALAYAQGTNIYVAPRQEKHLPHEAWHVVQQKQGRVRPTMHLPGASLNDDRELEREADVMGAKALTISQHNPSTKQGQELTDVVHQNKGGNTIQRAVGFEFQTTWGVQKKLAEKHWERSGLIPKHKSNREPYSSHDVIRNYDGFQMTADQASTYVGSEIEWVVDPIQESQGIGALNQVMVRLQNVVQSMVDLHQREKFTLNEVTGNPSDSMAEVLPNIKLESPNMNANAQVTGGVRLDQISNMFAQLGAPRRGGPNPDPHAEVQENLMGMGGAGILAVSAAAANNIPGQHSASFKGLAAQIIAYLKAGSIDPRLKGRVNQAFTYPKLIGKIMARTDFGAQFNLLPEAERQVFENNPQGFADIILRAANVGGGDVNVFERGIRNTRLPNAMTDVPVTRNEWITSIAQGQDRLTRQLHQGYIAQQLEGLGGFQNKTDRVGPDNVPAPILEFRQVKEQMPYTEWLPFATRVFEYLSYLNRNQSATQSAQSPAATAAQQ